MRDQTRGHARRCLTLSCACPPCSDWTLFRVQWEPILRMIVDQLQSIRWGTALLIAMAIAASGAVAEAGPYICDVPRALICEGCAEQISISLLPNGRCRISFTPTENATTPTVSPSSASTFVFSVVPGRAMAPTRLQRMILKAKPHTGFWRRRDLRPQINSVDTHCFVFNANRYCE
jgi:hypothetical protein